MRVLLIIDHRTFFLLSLIKWWGGLIQQKNLFSPREHDDLNLHFFRWPFLVQRCQIFTSFLDPFHGLFMFRYLWLKILELGKFVLHVTQSNVYSHFLFLFFFNNVLYLIISTISYFTNLKSKKVGKD